MTRESGGQELVASERRKMWLIIAFIIGLLGVGISAYSTNHYLQVKASGQTDAVCNINAQFSCDTVALSKYSEVAGTPVAILGLGFFLAICVLTGIGIAGGKSAKDHIHAYVALVVIGVIASIAFAGISYFQLNAFCPSCMVVYALTLAQLVAAFIFRSEIPGNWNLSGLLSGGSSAAIVVALTVVAFSYFGPKKGALDSPAPENDSSRLDSSSSEKETILLGKVQDIPISRSPYSGLGEDYRLGSDDAKVVIVEFADFQCPACKHTSETMTALHRDYGDKIQIVFRNYPLDKSCNVSMQSKMHEFACSAAILARCAGQYGKFWEYFRTVYANQEKISDANLKAWGLQIGLTQEQMDTCLASPDILAKIKDDVSLGNRLGVNATPTLFLNGQKIIGDKGINDIKRRIDDNLN